MQSAVLREPDAVGEDIIRVAVETSEDQRERWL